MRAYVAIDVYGHLVEESDREAARLGAFVDSTAGSTPAQLLHQAIGVGSLRVWADRQDNVGNAGLSN